MQTSDNRFYCHIHGCQKSFARREHLRRHALCHDPQNQLFCPICGKRFYRMDLKRKHERNLHNHISDEPLKARKKRLSHPDPLGNMPTLLKVTNNHNNSSTLETSNVNGLISSRGDKQFQKSEEPSTVSASESDLVCQPHNAPQSTAQDQNSHQNRTAHSRIPNEIDNMGLYGKPFGDSFGDPHAISVLGESLLEGISFDDSISWLFQNEVDDSRSSRSSGSIGSTRMTKHNGTEYAQFSPDIDLTSIDTPREAPDSADVENQWIIVSEKIIKCLFGIDPQAGGSPLESITLSNIYSDNLLRTDFFNPDVLRRHFQLYFENYHDHFPIVHQPSFRKHPEEVQPLLMVSIITLGTSFSTDYFKISVELHGRLRFLVLSHPKLTHPPLWILQSLLLIQAFEKMLGPRELHELSTTFHGAVVSVLRRGQLSVMEPETIVSLDLDTIWKKWIEIESTKRVVCLAFIMDAQHSVLFGHRPSMSANEVQVTLPCADYVWEYETAHEWWTMFGQENTFQKAEPLFLHALKSLLQRRPLSASTSAYSRLVLLHGLFSVAWQVQEYDAASLGMSEMTHSSREMWKDTLLRAIDTWSYSLFGGQSLGLEVCKALYRISYVALHLTRTSVIDILVFAGYPSLDGRPLWRRDYLRASTTIKAWASNKIEALICVRHSLLFIQETMFSSGPLHSEVNGYRTVTQYSAASDKVALRPWCLFLCLLCVLAYCAANEGNIEFDEPLRNSWVAGEEYSLYTIQKITQWLDSDRESNIKICDPDLLQGLCIAVVEALAGTRWELLEVAANCVDSLITSCRRRKVDAT
ncbi:hypothetical protein CANCADRAFT_32081 [Tortispora caseinolytica NRRL Y-17796]|uniref:C2H2-type domain-containing protein n=1 Tax=Tortispora caseinolytica NRRL Y-17796 TaxID=767744 RepID=A0A1E4T9S0_9ASCO|nr:hypothetical protein CANCADRAFT_32081 [Tortispora caseinolytica NRRL Y-17796]